MGRFLVTVYTVYCELFCMFIFQQTRESWQVVFFICAGVLMFGGIVYSLLGSGVIQPWAHKDVAPAPDGESIASATTDTP